MPPRSATPAPTPPAPQPAVAAAPERPRGHRKLWILLVLLLAAGAAYAGWWYGDDQGQKDRATLQKQLDGLKQPTKSESTTTDTQTAGNFEITQWGVVMTVPTGLRDLAYEIKTVSGNQIAYFSTKSLEAKAGGCTAASGAIGAISRESKLRSSDQPGGAASYHKVGSYYYYHSQPQSTCASDMTAQDLETSQVRLLTTAFDTLVAK